jgi:hypothetical protein
LVGEVEADIEFFRRTRVGEFADGVARLEAFRGDLLQSAVLVVVVDYMSTIYTRRD